MLSDQFLSGFKAGLRGRPRPRPAGAYDAMPRGMRRGRYARDDGDNDAASELIDYLESRLDPADFDEAVDLLDRCLGTGDARREMTGDSRRDRSRYGRDEPPPFPGRPRPGGRIDAMDAMALDRRLAGLDRARIDFSERFPDAARIRIV